MSHLHWTHFENKLARPLDKNNLPKGWMRTRIKRPQPHRVRSTSQPKRCPSSKTKSKARRALEKSLPSGPLIPVIHIDSPKTVPVVHSILLEDRTKLTSADLEPSLSTSSASSASTTSSTIDKVKSALGLTVIEEPIYFGPKDNRGWLQRYSQRRNARNARKRELKAREKMNIRVIIDGKRWTAWTHGESGCGWVAIPTVTPPTWREKSPFAKKLPEIFAGDRYDATDGKFKRVDEVLGEVSATMKRVKKPKKEKKYVGPSLFSLLRDPWQERPVYK